MKERRAELGGFVPERRQTYTPIEVPDIDKLRSVRKGSGKQEVASTMALVRAFKELMRDKELGRRVVPIIPDEARTFGLDSWFPTLKIYNPHGQNYVPVDHDLMLSYRESTDGQILHEGINEAGSVASFMAAGSSYATHGEPMIPLYIFYSMFGFQRTGDGIWAAADQMCRGFLIGATAGRTTLTGEGLQHMDGHSQILASTNPGVVSYDPAFAYEIAHLLHEGIDRMYGPDRGENVIYYLTVYNEPVPQPAEPENLDVEGLHKGMYLFSRAEELEVEGSHEASILASGVGMQWALKAQQMLAEEYGVKANVFSVTSWVELAREGAAKNKEQLRNPAADIEEAFATQQMKKVNGGTFVAVSDFATDLQEQIRAYVPGEYIVLGADGFGFSDTRPAARRYFNIDAESVVVAVLMGLAREGKIDISVAQEAAEKYRLDDPTAV